MRNSVVAAACVALALSSAAAAGIAPIAKPPVDAGACASGYVHRSARADDLVCVTQEAQDRTTHENADAPSRVDPKGAYGSNSCKAGYVWREAYKGDLVCVTPAVRMLVRDENRLGFERTLAFQADAAAVPEGPWLCGEETIFASPRSRSGHVIDAEGRVWAYGYGRQLLSAAWRKSETSKVVTPEELKERFAGASRAGRDIAVEDVALHLPLIEEAAKMDAVGTSQLRLQIGTSTLYCLAEAEAKGTYREIVLEKRGTGVQVNPSPAAKKLKAWFQPHFWVVN